MRFFRLFRFFRLGPAQGFGLLGSLFVLAACASAPSLRGSRYESRNLTFRVGPRPATWQRLETSHGLLAFRDESQSATVLVNGRCGKDAEDVPLAALSRHLFLQFTDRETEAETMVPFDGREALRTELRAKLDGVPKRFVAVVTKKNGCLLDFVLVAAPVTFPAARRDFDQFLAGFHLENP